MNQQLFVVGPKLLSHSRSNVGQVADSEEPLDYLKAPEKRKKVEQSFRLQKRTLRLSEPT
jgi:hypothetical protein